MRLWTTNVGTQGNSFLDWGVPMESIQDLLESVSGK